MQISRIDRDLHRFQDIVRGRIKENLRRYITHGRVDRPPGQGRISIPVPRIDIPRFRYGARTRPGSASARAAEGEDPYRRDSEGEGQGTAGEEPGQHMLEVDVSIDELAKILGEELELPRIEPQGEATSTRPRYRYSGIRRSGPESLRHFKRTLPRGSAAPDHDRDLRPGQSR